MSGTDSSGLVVVDAGIVIGHLDRANPHHPSATRALSEAVAARHAALLRASHRSLKLPDAFVIATAIVHRADVLLTIDRGWPSALTQQLPLRPRPSDPSQSADIGRRR